MSYLTAQRTNVFHFILFPFHGTAVRLVGGVANHLGRVEILYSGEWGTVCDNRWTINDGHVVCRMLGFSKAVQIFKSSAFKGGSGKIWLTKLVCNGTENSLFNCKNAVKYLGDTGCTHEQDAGVECLKDGKLSSVVISDFSMPLVFECILAVYLESETTFAKYV